MAVFKGMANVGYTFEFSLDFQRPDGDIGVVFVSEARKKDVARNASFDAFALALDSPERCPAYLEFSGGEGGVRPISRAEVLVSDQLSHEASNINSLADIKAAVAKAKRNLCQ